MKQPTMNVKVISKPKIKYCAIHPKMMDIELAKLFKILSAYLITMTTIKPVRVWHIIL